MKQKACNRERKAESVQSDKNHKEERGGLDDIREGRRKRSLV